MLVSGSDDWTVRCWDVNASGGGSKENAKGRQDDGFAAGLAGLSMTNGTGAETSLQNGLLELKDEGEKKT